MTPHESFIARFANGGLVWAIHQESITPSVIDDTWAREHYAAFDWWEH